MPRVCCIRLVLIPVVAHVLVLLKIEGIQLVAERHVLPLRIPTLCLELMSFAGSTRLRRKDAMANVSLLLSFMTMVCTSLMRFSVECHVTTTNRTLFPPASG